MEIVNWIDKNLSEIKDTLLYGKYFDSILLEEGIEGFYLLNPHLGIDLILRQDLTVEAIHFHAGNQKGTNEFIDKLPFNLNFAFPRDKTRSILGDPKETGGGDYSLIYGVTPDWERYVYDKYVLHLQFLPDNKGIDLVTVYSANWVPGN